MTGDSKNLATEENSITFILYKISKLDIPSLLSHDIKIYFIYILLHTILFKTCFIVFFHDIKTCLETTDHIFTDFI